jgi:Zn-finger nucleic acid-binding protein
LKCPACTKQMIVVEYHNIELDYCSSCHGTWFDRGEMELLLRSMELDETPNLLERISSQEEVSTSEEKRRCPICRRSMKKQAIGSNPQITIDYCAKNHGIWFDAGELRHLTNNLRPGEISEYSSEQELLIFLGEVFEVDKQK